jgi:hypothetical protein
MSIQLPNQAPTVDLIAPSNGAGYRNMWFRTLLTQLETNVQHSGAHSEIQVS